VHISELAAHHVENPREVVSQGDIVKAKIIDIDAERRRLSLSMKRVEEGEDAQPPIALVPGEAPFLTPPTDEEMAAAREGREEYVSDGEDAGGSEEAPELGLSADVFSDEPGVLDEETGEDESEAPEASAEPELVAGDDALEDASDEPAAGDDALDAAEERAATD
jgi:small subunit ribosomal protein S1